MATISENAANQRILFIDVARVIAILWIVGFWHLMEYSGDDFKTKYYLPAAKHISMVMLGLFMFISGNLLGKKKLETGGEIKAFYKSRFLRFYILYTLSAVIMFWIGKINNLSQLVTTLTATSTFILPQPLTLWFMSMLTIFYLLTPLIKRDVKTSLGVALLFILLHLIIPGGIDDSIFWYYLLYAIGLFTAGNEMVKMIIKKRSTLAVSLILSLIFFLGAMIYWRIGYLMIVPGIIFVLSLSCLIANKSIRPVISFIAYGSLCAYLFHRQIYYVLTELFDVMGIQHPLSLCILVMLPVCLITSFCIQRFYDKVLQIAIYNKQKANSTYSQS